MERKRLLKEFPALAAKQDRSGAEKPLKSYEGTSFFFPASDLCPLGRMLWGLATAAEWLLSEAAPVGGQECV